MKRILVPLFIILLNACSSVAPQPAPNTAVNKVATPSPETFDLYVLSFTKNTLPVPFTCAEINKNVMVERYSQSQVTKETATTLIDNLLGGAMFLVLVKTPDYITANPDVRPRYKTIEQAYKHICQTNPELKTIDAIALAQKKSRSDPN